MLPTKGFFKDIECPYNETSCWRPYCHFMHKKKPSETEANSEGETDGIPTYKPTPKSELEIIHNSHIPIQYVPDLVYQRPKISGGSSKCDKPTYNPTPLSILSSAKNKRLSAVEDNSENLKTIKEIKQTIADTEYVPTSVSGAVQPSLDIDFENLEQEFELIDDIIKNSTDNKNKNNKIVEDKKTKDEINKDAAVKEKKSEKRDKHKHRSKSSKSSDKSKEKREKSAKEEQKKDDRVKHRKEEHKDRKKHHSKEKKRDKSKKRSRSRSRDKKKSKNQEKKTKLIENDTDTSVGSKIEFDVDSDLDDEQDTMMECFKIFKEYQPEDNKPREAEPEQQVQQEEISIMPTVEPKKRIAHSNAIEKPITKQKHVPLPGQVMANRYKTALANQTEKEPEMLFKEIKQIKKPPPVSLLEAAKARKVQKELEKAKNSNIVDSILKGSNQQPVVATLHKPIKKIAPVQNVSLLTKAKERISKIKTIAHTQKGTRVAHIPGNVIEDIPDVIQADKSKLPVNVRTKFLTMIVDECKKLYLSKDEAYGRALNEEFSCYEKCKVLATYRNSAMLSINRLRKEIQERQASGLGLIEDSNECLTHSNLVKKQQFYQKVKNWVLTEDDLNLHGYPRECPTKPGRAVIMNSNKKNDGLNLSKNERCCARCKKIYRVNDVGWPLFDDECMYHPLRKRTLRGEQIYLCCKSNDDTGCWTSDTHVSENLDLDGFQTTMIPDSENDPRSYAVYALDCEMCYTTRGLELTRVTIVDTDCKTVYETLVKPMNPIIDYNTRFSGITKHQMDKTSTNILQVQANILHLCNSKTILVGHSLESDMKALKIVHSTIIDTSVLFPHKMGLPHKRALKSLATDYLRKIIQNDVNGHDSAEDAITCMELLNWKLKEELKSGVK